MAMVDLLDDEIELITRALDSHWHVNRHDRSGIIKLKQRLTDVIDEIYHNEHDEDEYDGQPTWEQEWADFGECYGDEYGDNF